MIVEPIIGEELWVHLLPGGTPVARRIRRQGSPFRGIVDRRPCIAVHVQEIGNIGAGTLTAPVAELGPAAPLGPADRAEYDRLDRALAGTKGDRRKLQPFFSLLKRAVIYGEEGAQ